MGSVVKHSYIKGPGLPGRARAHMDYIQNRPEEDGEVKGTGAQKGKGSSREFQTLQDVEKGAGARQFKQAFVKENTRNNVVHKMILSPGHNGVDMNKFTREVLTGLGRMKGQDLRAGWVIHENTKHKHAHVIILGKDMAGGQVRFNKLDHMRLRALGDRYLEREHGIERHLDADMERWARSRGLNVMFEKERGHEFFKLLSEPDKNRGKGDKQKDTDSDWLDEQWDTFLEKIDWEPQGGLGGSYYHNVGRLTEWHLLSQNLEDQKTWQEVLENNPELKDMAQQKLNELAEQKQGIVADIAEQTGITNPMGFLEQVGNSLRFEASQLAALLSSSQYEPGDLTPPQGTGDVELSEHFGEQSQFFVPEFLEPSPNEQLPSTDDIPGPAAENSILSSMFADAQHEEVGNSELKEIDQLSNLADCSIENIFDPSVHDQHDVDDFAHELVNGIDLEGQEEDQQDQTQDMIELGSAGDLVSLIEEVERDQDEDRHRSDDGE